MLFYHYDVLESCIREKTLAAIKDKLSDASVTRRSTIDPANL